MTETNIVHKLAPYSGHPDQTYGPTTYAQNGEDLMILNLFDLLDVPVPSYLDLGAHHPVILSNTKALYDRGSHGVNVEANPNLIESFKLYRPDDINLNLGVGPVAGEATFYMYSDTSGRNTFSADEVAGQVGLLTVKRELPLPIATVNDIVRDHCSGDFPQFLSCDLEGLDFGVLSGADFVSSSPMIICVETRRDNTKRMAAMLERKGFTVYCRMGENLLFVRNNLKHLVY